MNTNTVFFMRKLVDVVLLHILAQVEHSFWRNLNTYSESR